MLTLPNLIYLLGVSENPNLYMNAHVYFSSSIQIFMECLPCENDWKVEKILYEYCDSSI